MNCASRWASILVGLLTLHAAAERTFLVSPVGNDAWSGTIQTRRPDGTDGPFATLARAQRAVRQRKAAGLTEPVEIRVLEGTYRLAEPLLFTPADSGTQAAPITWRAQGKVIVSGGKLIDNWRPADGAIYTADVPEAAGGKWRFKILRIGDRWAIRARHPNLDPKEPTRSGWLFADWHGEPWECGLLNRAVADIHNVGDKLTWRIRVPAAGKYVVWGHYSSQMKSFAVEDMGGRTALRVDGGEPVTLEHLPDTGGWSKYAWSKSARLQLEAGQRVLTWENKAGGGIGLDALALTQDESWDPNAAISQPTWWGAFDIKPPAAPHNLVLIQAEACEKAEGKDIKVPTGTPAGITKYLRFKPGDIPESLVPVAEDGAEVHVFPAWGWVNGIVPIERIDRDSRKIIFPGSGAAQDIRMGNRYYIENVRAALDAPGEWFLDEKTGRVDFMLFEGLTPPHDAVAPRLDRLIELRGEKDSWVEHVNFVGFAFSDTDYTVAGDYYSPADAAIHLSRARHCAIRECEFTRLGGYAARIEAGTHDLEFTGNDLHDLGQGGLILLGSTNADQPHHIRIAGNTMRRLGLIYKHVGGVYCTTSSDNEIVHNTFSDLTRYAVALKSYSEQACSLRNRVEFNDIRRTNLETNDTGAIETLGRNKQDTGNVIRHNLILDVVGMGTDRDGHILSPYFNWGIYLDDYSSGTTVYGNIVARTANGGICVHAGKNNLFENNVFVDAGAEQIRLQPRDEFMRYNRFVRNIVAFSGPGPLIYSWDSRPERFAEWDYNVYGCRDLDLAASKKKMTPLGSYTKWRSAGMDTFSQVADPLFVDAAHDDYRLRPHSPARTLGFKPIPVEQIGADYWRKHVGR